MLHSTCFFSLFLSFTLHLSGINSAKMTFINQCNYTVWPALTSNVNLSATGFVLPSGQTSSVNVPVNWRGQIWGRTLCTTDTITGNFSCVTGDCNSGKIACDNVGSAPNTLVEFALDSNSGLDSYDVSLADGFNMPVIVVPVSGSDSNCESTGCVLDLNAVCPTELKLTRNKEVVACQDPCRVFRTEEYCCFRNRSSCEPTTFSTFFKTACPQAYSYKKDDATSTFNCSTPADYNIVFCPKSSNASRKVGDSLIAGGNETSKWLSPSGDFAFGFYQLPNKLFLLAIWYNQIQNTTIIWSANGDNLAPIGSKLELNDSHGLVLKNPQGIELWTSNFTSGTIFNGLMNDDGNFQIFDQNFMSLWESFSHPTDTLVPTQVLELGGELSSRQGEFNFSIGRFKLHLQEDGNLVFKLVNLLEPYFNTGTADSNDETNVGIKFVFDKPSFLYVLKKNGEKFKVSNEKTSSNDVYYKATINYDGVFTVSYYPKDPKKEQRWVTLNAIPENICLNSTFKDGGGVCGLNSICNLKEDDRRPICNCQERYSLIDSNNMYGGCIPHFLKQKKKNDHDTLIIVISVLLGFSMLVILMLVGAMYFGFSYNRKKIKSGRTNNGVIEKNLCNFTFNELVEATGNFSEELGRGSFSIVYKGTIDMTSLAVKKLDKLFRDNDKEFQTEMNVIGQTHHRNLVRLLGYCNEGQHRILVYEFMSNGILASFLFTPLKANWRQRFEIASGIARDFGLAKLLLINQSHTETGIRGTKGRNVEKELVDEEKGILTDWAYDCFKTRRLDILLENDDEAVKNIKSFEKFVMIALWCIHEDPSLRPTMKKVLLMLEGIVEVSIPPNPYLYGFAS
ncbi:hypothetical protein VNO80_30397 [Phaseolus coccineus]|uniref:non-specific serine/threonine protein kinase n=1 Tax=Phaseolus coccineus TaxID=3886 RepID=A0AAN9QG21_PHACN